MSTTNNLEEGGLPIGELLIIDGKCCAVSSCIFTKHCIGFTSEGMVLCTRFECKGCRPVFGKNENKTCCILCQGSNECVVPQTCCLVQQQCFCLDSRIAFPCTKDVPCIFTCLPGCTVCVNWKMNIACCKKFKDFPELAGQQQTNKEQPPSQVIMVRDTPPPQPQPQPQIMMVQQPQQPIIMVQQPQPQVFNSNSYVVQQQPRTMLVTVPLGVLSGQMLTVTSPEGLTFQVQVPAGVVGGQQFQAQY
jgi:hypothetical protein